MSLKHIYFLFLGILSASAVQVTDQGMEKPAPADFLLKIDETTSDQEEFLYIFNKNRQRADSALSRAAFEENFELFVNYKLKVKYAIDLGLDQSEEFRSEFASFKADIIKPYLQENKLEDGEMQRVYERMNEMVKASHILLQFPPNASKEDSMAVYRMAKKLKSEAESGADFSKLALDYSEDPSVKDNQGSLGYFTALQMVLPFEEAAFALNEGEISEPVLSDFGYHVIRLEDRKTNPGQIRVSHLLIRSPAENPESEAAAQKKIAELYQTLQADPAQWPDLVSAYSEDPGSKSNQGIIPWFGPGAIVPEFERAAFDLQQIGDFTAPVKTRYGYHIIRLEGKRPVPPFEELKPTIQARISRGSKSGMLQDKIMDLQKKLLQVEVNDSLLSDLDDIFSSLRGKPYADLLDKLAEVGHSNTDLVQSNRHTATLGNFINQVKVALSDTTATVHVSFDELFQPYLKNLLASWEEEYLYATNTDYRQLINEYRNGMLLFELMNREVWQKAVDDSTGQQKYFLENRQNYLWGDRIPAVLVKARADKDLSDVGNWLAEQKYHSKLDSLLKEKFLLDDPLLFTLEQKEFEISENKLLASLDLSQKFHQLHENGEMVLVLSGEKIPAAPKKFEEIRGRVIQDYQQYLEENLLQRLHKKYTIQINEDEKEKIYRSLEK
ncbi:peptidyl-prolyl cis-trans isomerase SurA [Cyclobacterium lianum]|uniref:Peptidyl-prolyl cis-trans isomerase SurA n=1 Tax=Cyclobacterium lianum TaxID=388280 RepID=A0A1M7IQT5_9BACT|nr:peptidylprolyl isomerase [Cyclobacterium lianum]SHM43039.1 peptidyl-prolyl cis-trans isomerase SurA [Cyclobacterium lianum]